MKNNFDPSTREDALRELWGRRAIFEIEDKLDEFEKLEKEIKNIPVLNLVVAIDFRPAEVVEIFGKVKEVFERELFLDIRVDPSLIGGCQVIWEGVVYDYSLRKIIQDKKNEFREIVQSAWK